MIESYRPGMRMRVILTLGAVGVLVASASACSRSVANHDDGRLQVVAAFYPVQEAAQRVGGKLVDVTNLTAPGVEPHDLELTPDQVEAIATADVVLYLGEGFQPAVGDAVSDAQGITVDLLSVMPTAEPPPGSEAGLTVDPHVWLDPVLYEKMIEEVEAAFAKADPSNAPTYASNARAFSTQVSELDAAYRSGLASCQRRTIVTNHAAFGYLASRYGLTQEAISGLSPDAEPSAQRLADLASLVTREGITTIFTEDLVSPKVAQTLADEVGVKTAVLHTLEGLTDQEIAAGQDYLSQMRENLSTLEAALGCS